MQRLIARRAEIAAFESRRERAVERGVELLQAGWQRVPRRQQRGEEWRLYDRRISKANREFEGHGSRKGQGWREAAKVSRSFPLWPTS